MPAGKAVALAAMPSAVLMGMGLTPQLALAKPPLPEPFEGQCATAPDESPSPGASPSAGAGKESGKSPAPGPSKSAGDGKGGPAAPEPPKDPVDPERPKGAAKDAAEKAREAAEKAREAIDKLIPPGTLPSPEPDGKKPGPAGESSPAPSASKATDPLDPLGLGDKLKDILTGGDGTGAKPPAAPSPSPSASGATRKPAPAPGGTPSGKATPEDGKATPRGKAGAEPSAKPSGGTPTRKADSGASPSASSSASPSPSASASPGPGGLPPCPKGAAADGNDGHAFPHQPWYLEAGKLTLTGLTYRGVQEITMVNNEKKRVLKFTADALAIQDLHQIVNKGGKQYHVAGAGTQSTVGGGEITMYTEELKGKLLGLIPSTQSPTSLPPLIPGVKLPIPIFFTDVKIRQAGQFGGTLHIPNLRQTITDGTYP
ncbi:hypothetical protein ACFQ2B_36905 [Streptomyces stramineus]